MLQIILLLIEEVFTLLTQTVLDRSAQLTLADRQLLMIIQTRNLIMTTSPLLI